jgi:hypothetical protein
MKKNKVHFRVETMNLLNEIADSALPAVKAGVLVVPLNVLRNLLGQLAQRCTQLHDPVLDRIMFDMTLYELPRPSTPEYGKLMKQLYATEAKYLKESKKAKSILKHKYS